MYSKNCRVEVLKAVLNTMFAQVLGPPELRAILIERAKWRSRSGSRDSTKEAMASRV